MSLGSNLASDIQGVFDSHPADPTTAANGLALAYYNYVSGSKFGLSAPVLPTALRDAMAATLAAGLALPGLAATAAAAYGGALATFWTGVAVAGASGAGSVAGCPGSTACIATLTAGFLSFPATSALAAAGIAAALATATLTITCALGPPSSTTVPIS